MDEGDYEGSYGPKCIYCSYLTVNCFIYDCFGNDWSTTPATMQIFEECYDHTASVLGGKIVVAGGYSRFALENEHGPYSGSPYPSLVECMDIHDLLECAPLIYPLPTSDLSQMQDNWLANIYQRMA